jgi:hypothetical protein
LPEAVLKFLRWEAKAWGMKLSWRMVTNGAVSIVARLRDGRLGAPLHHNPGMAQGLGGFQSAKATSDDDNARTRRRGMRSLRSS